MRPLPLILLALAMQASAQDGIAARYPGDVGIAADPDVIFAENFEGGDVSGWDEKKGPVQAVADDPNQGRYCVRIPMRRGANTGGHLIKWFMPGADTVYVRFYVKFSADYQYNHHFVWLLANQASNKWSAFGKAGVKPDGTYFSTGMEPNFAWGKNPPPGEINFYSYFIDMRRDEVDGMYWGNAFFPPGPERGVSAGPDRVLPPLDKWQCWEFMLQANSAPDLADGRQTMWVDGVMVGDFPGIRWRTDMELKVNALWLEHYGYDAGDPTKKYWKDQQTVWFDDVVVARSYIGPISR